jgi:hypothetical protein
MDLLAFFNAFATQARQSAGVNRVALDPNDPTRAYYANNLDGIIHDYQLVPPPRKHCVTTIASFGAAFAAYAGGAKAVWVSLEKIVGVFNDGEKDPRNQTLEMAVVKSEIFWVLADIDDTNDQRELLALLRHDLKPTKITPDGFELAVSNLTWEENRTTEGNFGVVKSSMGKQITGEVRGERDIPLEVSVEFDAFPALANEFEAIVKVDCSVTIDPLEQTITVKPYPGQLDQAKAKAVELLRAKIAEVVGDPDGAKTFAGTP